MPDISLEIYQLDVYGGDATAILVWDLGAGGKAKKPLYSVLIDSGAEGKGSALLETYLMNELGVTNFDCMIATHYHDDHIKGLSKKSSIRFKKFIDNGGYAEAPETAPNGIGADVVSRVFTQYRSRIGTHVNRPKGQKARRLKLPFVNPTNDADKQPFAIELGSKDIKLVCYCANGILADGTNVLRAQKKRGKDTNANDMSLAFVLEWGNFRYFNAGDLSGENTSQYYDIESHLVTYLSAKGVFPAGAVSVYKASHHGSDHSNQTGLLQLVKPRTVIVSANQGKGVPGAAFLTRLKKHFERAGADPGENVVFSNKLSVHSADDLYKPLKALRDANRIVPDNVDVTEKKALDNNHVKCVLIRRRVRNGVAVRHADVPKPRQPEYLDVVGRLSAAGDAYEVVMMKRDEDEAKKLIKQSAPTTYKLTARWEADACGFGDIKQGFDKQAAAMKTWFERDAKTRASTGEDYLSENYPALADTWGKAKTSTDLKSKALARMQDMFGKGFQEQTDKKTGLRLFVPREPATELTGEEQQTLCNLLLLNCWQGKYNAAIKNTEPYWNTVKDDEPYRTAEGKKRKAEQITHSKRLAKKARVDYTE